jgi:hypothetical protein
MAPTTKITNVPEFLAQLAPDRRQEVEHVRAEIRRRLPTGYEEAISGKMLVYQVPLGKYSDTYNGHPLWYVALASQKSYLSLHLMPVYGDSALAARLALDTIGEIVASIPMDRWIKIAQAARRR